MRHRTWIGAVVAVACLMPSAAATSQSIDELFSELNRRVPEFGGMYRGQDGSSSVVFLTAERPGILDEFRTAFREVFGAEYANGTPLDVIVIRRADFTWLQLDGWRSAFEREQPEVEAVTGGSIGTDIDDGTNRLAIFLSDPAAQTAAAEAKLHELQIPEEAVAFREASSAVALVGEGSHAMWWLLLAIVVLSGLIFGFVYRRRPPALS